MSYDLNIAYRPSTEHNTSLEFQLDLALCLVNTLAPLDTTLAAANWLVAVGDSREQSLLHDVFDVNGVKPSALAVLAQKNKDNTALKSFTLWNGHESRTQGASLS